MTKRMTKGKLEKLRLADVAAKEAWFDAYEVNCKAHQQEMLLVFTKPPLKNKRS